MLGLQLAVAARTAQVSSASRRSFMALAAPTSTFLTPSRTLLRPCTPFSTTSLSRATTTTPSPSQPIHRPNTTTASNTTAEPLSQITWTQYFAFRKSRKNWERAGAILGGTLGFVGGGYYFAAVADFDPTQQILGIPDPTYVYVLGTIAIGAVMTIAGISVGSAAWRMSKSRQILRSLDSRDKEFFRRIQRHRPKEIAAVVPVPGGQGGMPDYYGEKIFSVKDYKEWLRRQKTFTAGRQRRLGHQPQHWDT
ncbi:mitochondrial import protein Pam17-domain-containing protein [Fimicolochytrium jonesii]|uniref:mitochondrial import protein Pam17-domain-containing protein n=1 Tax=Fimicolochytrium jonesii TaxID=1396493 RepID=UPI0022FDD6D1|nr:mitochondrial import protein Pam17-domain-containing protein [Fimicolochytrium jonesii]KAI8825268.1 mitochondrial import protein Pam17-domain-containing protein [Fimicolochytrium jonesii]